MSMNLICYMNDRKGRTVKKIEMYQTPTDITFKVLPDRKDKQLTLENISTVLSEYFDFIEKHLDEEYSTAEKERFEDILKEYSDDYTFYVSYI